MLRARYAECSWSLKIVHTRLHMKMESIPFAQRVAECLTSKLCNPSIPRACRAAQGNIPTKSMSWSTAQYKPKVGQAAHPASA